MSQDRLNAPQVHADFVEQLEVTRQRLRIDDIALTTDSNNGSEKYGFLQAVPPLSEFTGTTEAVDLPANEIEVHNTEYRGAFDLGGRDYKRDKTGSASQRAKDMASRAILKPWTLLQDLIKSGDAATFGTCYDGKNFFSTTHEIGDSGVINNAVTASEVASLNVSTSTHPTAEEAADIIMDLTGHLMTFKDAAGQEINEDATRFGVLFKPTGGMMSGVFNSLFANNLAAGESNVLRVGVYDFIPIPMPRLDWTAEIAVARLDGSVRPMIVQTEQEPDLILLDEESEYYKQTKKVRMMADWTGGVAYGQFLHIVKGTLS